MFINRWHSLRHTLSNCLATSWSSCSKNRRSIPTSRLQRTTRSCNRPWPWPARDIVLSPAFPHFLPRAFQPLFSRKGRLLRWAPWPRLRPFYIGRKIRRSWSNCRSRIYPVSTSRCRSQCGCRSACWPTNALLSCRPSHQSRRPSGSGWSDSWAANSSDVCWNCSAILQPYPGLGIDHGTIRYWPHQVHIFSQKILLNRLIF